MFVARNARANVLLHIPRRLPVASRVHKRNVGSMMQTLSEGFLDLAQALPLPASFPPYSTTIILVTIVTRLALTVPFSVWVRASHALQVP